MNISKRLQKLSKAAGGAHVLADVGCDHGYAALEILNREASARAVLIDTNAGPLSIAAENMRQAGVMPRCSFYLSDGLRALCLSDRQLKTGERKKRDVFWTRYPDTCPDRLKQEDAAKISGLPGCSVMPDTILISGMGGRLIRDILSLLPTNGDISCDRELLLKEAVSFLSGVRRLVLSPQSEPSVLRHFLIDELQARITDEEMLSEDGKYYVIITAEPCRPGEKRQRDPRYQMEWDYENGVILAEKKDMVYREYLLAQKNKLSKLLKALSGEEGEAARERAQELMELLIQTENALGAYEEN
ncbi:MAG: class I SAM-dependent methyltransferase [Eubacteriales bacterium]|nr:class I SAM-dependent methyltransferase [Eubacteriales bacterium]